MGIEAGRNRCCGTQYEIRLDWHRNVETGNGARPSDSERGKGIEVNVYVLGAVYYSCGDY